MRRGFSYENSGDKARNGSVTQESMWDLDTDLTHMEGILSQPLPVTPPLAASSWATLRTKKPEEKSRKVMSGWAWSMGCPDSWAVKKVGDENMGRLREIDEAGIPQKDEADSTPHCVRIFRIDFTFATISPM
jgi:adenylate cyclase